MRLTSRFQSESIARGEEATPEQELKYIDEARHKYYLDLIDMPAPVEERSLCDGTLLTTLEDGVLSVSLNRPAVHNAMTLDQVPVLTSALEEASGRLDVRVVVLQGSGEHFCTGADLRAVGGGPRAGRPTGAPAMTVGDAARMIRTGWQRSLAGRTLLSV